jgi:hypothetical protein
MMSVDQWPVTLNRIAMMVKIVYGGQDSNRLVFVTRQSAQTVMIVLHVWAVKKGCVH